MVLYMRINGVYLTYLTNKNTLCFPLHEINIGQRKWGKKQGGNSKQVRDVCQPSAMCVCRQVGKFSLQHLGDGGCYLKKPCSLNMSWITFDIFKLQMFRIKPKVQISLFNLEIQN